MDYDAAGRVGQYGKRVAEPDGFGRCAHGRHRMMFGAALQAENDWSCFTVRCLFMWGRAREAAIEFQRLALGDDLGLR